MMQLRQDRFALRGKKPKPRRARSERIVAQLIMIKKLVEFP
jgi:hypothetical protein